MRARDTCDDDRRIAREQLAGYLWFGVVMIVVCLIAGALIVSLVGVAAGQTNTTTTNSTAKAPYYANNSTDTGQSEWLAGIEEATLPNVAELLVRVGPFVIGGGQPAQGGVGSAGVMMLGLVLAGIILGALSNAQAGPVAGAVLGTASAGGLVAVGIAPAWLFAVLVVLVALVVAVVFIRGYQ